MTFLVGLLILTVMTLISVVILQRLWYSIKLTCYKVEMSVPLHLRIPMLFLAVVLLAPTLVTMGYLISLL